MHTTTTVCHTGKGNNMHSTQESHQRVSLRATLETQVGMTVFHRNLQHVQGSSTTITQNTMSRSYILSGCLQQIGVLAWRLTSGSISGTARSTPWLASSRLSSRRRTLGSASRTPSLQLERTSDPPLREDPSAAAPPRDPLLPSSRRRVKKDSPDAVGSLPWGGQRQDIKNGI